MDVKFKAKQLQEITEALHDIGQLRPTPTPKGRYAMAKILKALISVEETFRDQHDALATKFGKKDADGNVVKVMKGNSYSVELEDIEGFRREMKELGEEEITLPGTRALTHEELAECPITPRQEAALLGNVLEDKAPE